jgi:hypothetical protein
MSHRPTFTEYLHLSIKLVTELFFVTTAGVSAPRELSREG